MQSVDPNEIAKRFKFFRNTDPRLYEQLVRLLDARVQELMIGVTVAPPDQILVCQGRAQEALKFFRIFTELPPDDPVQSVSPRPAP